VIAVLFESQPYPGKTDVYLEAGARLGRLVESFDGFLGIERFQSLTNPGKLLAVSYWRDEESVERWRNLPIHRDIQQTSRKSIFSDYRLRIASVIRDYTMNDRREAPEDSKAAQAKGERD
jgi:heme-degrading monooxygenase HmoA